MVFGPPDVFSNCPRYQAAELGISGKMRGRTLTVRVDSQPMVTIDTFFRQLSCLPTTDFLWSEREANINRKITVTIQIVKIIIYVSISFTVINFIKLCLTNFWKKEGIK